MITYLLENWERVVFRVFGLASFSYGAFLVTREKITDGAVLFGIGFLLFLYSSMARFKRFKGLGFEAELWEEKQEEAEKLIERLRSIIEIYSREVLLQKVMSGRWANGPRWEQIWKLYNDLVGQHASLGSEIDTRNIKAELDTWFLFDIVQRHIDAFRVPIRNAQAQANRKIAEKYGSPIKDAAGYAAEMSLIGSNGPAEEPLDLARERRLAHTILSDALAAKERLHRHFGIEVVFEPEAISVLEKVAKQEARREVEITPELIRLAEYE